MSVECRSPHQASIDTIFGAVEKLLAQLQAEGYQIETVGLMDVAPVHLSEKVTAALSQGLRENGLPLKTLPSGAGHDSMFISQVTDVGMLFAPSKNGRSHCPEEFTSAGRYCQVLRRGIYRPERVGSRLSHPLSHKKPGLRISGGPAFCFVKTKQRIRKSPETQYALVISTMSRFPILSYSIFAIFDNVQ